MKRATLSLALAIVFIAAAAAQDKPNFAGTWKSESSFNSWTIAVEGSKMTVTMTVAGNSESTVYMLDGTPSKKILGNGGQQIEQISTSTWEGNVLVTTIATPTSTRTERRSIEADGTMKIENTLVVQGKSLPSPPPTMLKKVG